jgi:hypothetical protein
MRKQEQKGGTGGILERNINQIDIRDLYKENKDNYNPDNLMKYNKAIVPDAASPFAQLAEKLIKKINETIKSDRTGGLEDVDSAILISTSNLSGTLVYEIYPGL